MNNTIGTDGFGSMILGGLENRITRPYYAMAIGSRNTVNGLHSFAIGRGNDVSGVASFAIGKGSAVTHNYAGVLSVTSNAASQGDGSIAMAFAGGASNGLYLLNCPTVNDVTGFEPLYIDPSSGRVVYFYDPPVRGSREIEADSVRTGDMPTLSNADVLKSVRPSGFDWKSIDCDPVAETVRRVAPDVANGDPSGNPFSTRHESNCHQRMISFLIKENEDIRQELAKMREEIARIRERIGD